MRRFLRSNRARLNCCCWAIRPLFYFLMVGQLDFRFCRRGSSCLSVGSQRRCGWIGKANFITAFSVVDICAKLRRRFGGLIDSQGTPPFGLVSRDIAGQKFSVHHYREPLRFAEDWGLVAMIPPHGLVIDIRNVFVLAVGRRGSLGSSLQPAMEVEDCEYHR